MGRHPIVIAFSSGQEGVGKSNMVVYLAYAMAAIFEKVIILDADNGQIASMLGLKPKGGLYDIRQGKAEAKATIVSGSKRIKLLLLGRDGFGEQELSKEEALFLRDAVEEICKGYDVILINTPPGDGEGTLFLNLAAYKRTLVISPDPRSITTTYSLLKKLAENYQIQDFDILITGTNNDQEARKIFTQLTALADHYLGVKSIHYLGFIPSKIISDIQREKKEKARWDADSKTGKQFLALAHSLIKKRSQEYVDGNIKFFSEQLFGA